MLRVTVAGSSSKIVTVADFKLPLTPATAVFDEVAVRIIVSTSSAEVSLIIVIVVEAVEAPLAMVNELAAIVQSSPVSLVESPLAFVAVPPIVRPIGVAAVAVTLLSNSIIYP